MNEPVFILGPPRSFTSIICAMLGQHPQMYGLPELQLFGAETMSEWWRSCWQTSFPLAHGLLRAVAQLYYGEQTERTIALSTGWVRRRLTFTTGLLFEQLAEKVDPLILIDKSPGIVYSIEYLQRVYNMFPAARFIHLVRHPKGHGESVMKVIYDTEKLGPVPSWMVHLASFPSLPTDEDLAVHPILDLDPQRGWYHCHQTIRRFLEVIPASQKMTVQAENMLHDPDQGLRSVASWLGLRADPQVLEAMKHPERSPYACFGPPSAPLGNDPNFLERPALRPDRAGSHLLDGPTSWRPNGNGLSPEVKELARQFGYD